MDIVGQFRANEAVEDTERQLITKVLDQTNSEDFASLIYAISYADKQHNEQVCVRIFSPLMKDRDVVKNTILELSRVLESLNANEGS